MKKNIFYLLPFFSLVIILNSALYSDDFFAVKEKIIENAKFKYEFLYFTPLFLLENVGYNSNIYAYDKKETPDWTADAGLGLRASAIVANRLILQAEDLPYYSFYLKTENQRSWSNRFGVATYSYVGPLNFKAGFTRKELRQRPNLEFGRPYRYIDREWSAETDIGRRGSLFLTAYARFAQLEYEENSYLQSYDLAESLNHRQTVFGFKLNQHVFTQTMIFANYELTNYVFASRSDRDARAQQLALGVEFPEIGVLQGSCRIGVKQLNPANPQFQTVRRPSGRGDISVSLFERLRLNLSYELQTYFSYSASELFYDNLSFGAGAQVYLTRFLRCGATYQDGRLKYYSFLDLALKRSDHLRQQQFSLAVPFFSGMAIGLSYSIYRLTSEALSLDVTRKFWGGYLTYAF